MAELHSVVTVLNAKLAAEPGPEMFKMIDQLSQTQIQVNAMESEWLSLSEKREALDKALKGLTGAS
jgi:hypothetical protein